VSEFEGGSLIRYWMVKAQPSVSTNGFNLV